MLHQAGNSEVPPHRKSHLDVALRTLNLGCWGGVRSPQLYGCHRFRDGFPTIWKLSLTPKVCHKRMPKMGVECWERWIKFLDFHHFNYCSIPGLRWSVHQSQVWKDVGKRCWLKKRTSAHVHIPPRIVSEDCCATLPISCEVAVHNEIHLTNLSRLFSKFSVYSIILKEEDVSMCFTCWILGTN